MDSTDPFRLRRPRLVFLINGNLSREEGHMLKERMSNWIDTGGPLVLGDDAHLYDFDQRRYLCHPDKHGGG